MPEPHFYSMDIFYINPIVVAQQVNVAKISISEARLEINLGWN